jgi:hypothetical protein
MAKKPEFNITTDAFKSFNTLNNTITDELHTADKTAAKNPKKFPSKLLLKLGCTIKIIPSIVTLMLNMLNHPHCSFKNILENNATNTGVLYIITEQSPKFMF